MNTLRTTSPHREQHGLSLIELMIAVSLGLLIIGVVIGIFLSGNRNYAQDERYARVQENGRFAMKTLTTEIANIDFWGGLASSGGIATLDTVCGIALNGGNALQIYADAAAAVAAVTGIDGSGCITAAKDNTSVIVVKRVQGTCLASAGDPVFSPKCATTAPVPNHAYLRVSGPNDGNLLTATDGAVIDVGDRYWEYTPRIYYIRDFAVVAGDGIPTLVRIDLKPKNTVALVEGIENFVITLGISSGADAPLPIKVHLLARSLDRDLAYDANRVDVKTYRLGASCFNTAGDSGCIALETIDNTPHQYYRKVFASTAAARNPGILNQYQ